MTAARPMLMYAHWAACLAQHCTALAVVKHFAHTISFVGRLAVVAGCYFCLLPLPPSVSAPVHCTSQPHAIITMPFSMKGMPPSSPPSRVITPCGLLSQKLLFVE